MHGRRSLGILDEQMPRWCVSDRCQAGGCVVLTSRITEVSFEPFFTTKFEFYYLKTLRRLPFPSTAFWAGRNVTVAKKWRVAPVPGTVRSGSVTIKFTRRR
jgi:hypothetical protein